MLEKTERGIKNGSSRKKIATLGTQYTGRRQIKTNKKQQGKLKR